MGWRYCGVFGPTKAEPNGGGGARPCCSFRPSRLVAVLLYPGRQSSCSVTPTNILPPIDIVGLSDISYYPSHVHVATTTTHPPKSFFWNTYNAFGTQHVTIYNYNYIHIQQHRLPAAKSSSEDRQRRQSSSSQQQKPPLQRLHEYDDYSSDE